MDINFCGSIYFLDPVQLSGEGQYNLNILKEISVTDYFLGLDQDKRKCQNEEPYYNCTTKFFLNAMRKKCGCLPMILRYNSEKV